MTDFNKLNTNTNDNIGPVSGSSYVLHNPVFSIKNKSFTSQFEQPNNLYNLFDDVYKNRKDIRVGDYVVGYTIKNRKRISGFVKSIKKDENGDVIYIIILSKNGNYLKINSNDAMKVNGGDVFYTYSDYIKFGKGRVNVFKNVKENEVIDEAESKKDIVDPEFDEVLFSIAYNYYYNKESKDNLDKSINSANVSNNNKVIKLKESGDLLDLIKERKEVVDKLYNFLKSNDAKPDNISLIHSGSVNFDIFNEDGEKTKQKQQAKSDFYFTDNEFRISLKKGNKFQLVTTTNVKFLINVAFKYFEFYEKVKMKNASNYVLKEVSSILNEIKNEIKENKDVFDSRIVLSKLGLKHDDKDVKYVTDFINFLYDKFVEFRSKKVKDVKLIENEAALLQIHPKIKLNDVKIKDVIKSVLSNIKDLKFKGGDDDIKFYLPIKNKEYLNKVNNYLNEIKNDFINELLNNMDNKDIIHFTNLILKIKNLNKTINNTYFKVLFYDDKFKSYTKWFCYESMTGNYIFSGDASKLAHQKKLLPIANYIMSYPEDYTGGKTVIKKITPEYVTEFINKNNFDFNFSFKGSSGVNYNVLRITIKDNKKSKNEVSESFFYNYFDFNSFLNESECLKLEDYGIKLYNTDYIIESVLDVLNEYELINEFEIESFIKSKIQSLKDLYGKYVKSFELEDFVKDIVNSLSSLKDKNQSFVLNVVSNNVNLIKNIFSISKDFWNSVYNLIILYLNKFYNAIKTFFDDNYDNVKEILKNIFNVDKFDDIIEYDEDYIRNITVSL